MHERSSIIFLATMTSAKEDARSLDEQLHHFEKKYSFVRPDRGDISAYPTNAWRDGKIPDYRMADLAYMKGKSKNHKGGSLEEIVENLVKKWEMESLHIPNPKDWTVIDQEKYGVQNNGGKVYTAQESAPGGSYNWLMDAVPKDLYDNSTETFETSLRLFRNTFTDGFAWEVLEVFSGPPTVSFTWRHWGVFNGEYKGRKGDGNMYELYGFNVVEVNDDLKIQKISVYYKPTEFLEGLTGKRSASDLTRGQSLLGNCCPIHKTTEEH